MPEWSPVLIWWLAFGGTHVLLSSMAVRRPLIAALGERGFQGLYSLVALATFIPLVRSYWTHKHAGPLLWGLGGIPGVHAMSIVLSEIACVFIVASFLQPSPTSLIPGVLPRARGMTRITRHPLFAGLGLWGLAHTLTNGFLSDVIFFGGFLVYGIVGAMHQDARKQITQGERLSAFYAETSLLPFAAIATGRTQFVASEMPWAGIVVGLAVGAGLYLLHPRLFIG